MSTLPTLIDELRKCEREWDGSNMFELARMCRDAADMLDENAKLRELVRDVVLLAGLNGCDVTNMQMHAHGGDWRAIWERMSELGVPGTEVDE